MSARDPTRLTHLTLALLVLACGRDEPMHAGPSTSGGTGGNTTSATAPTGTQPLPAAGASAPLGAGAGGSGAAGAPAEPPALPAAGTSAVNDPDDAGTPTPDASAPTSPTLGPDCDADLLASKQPFGRGFYQEFQGLFGCTTPADLALYRAMLPMKFDPPADPRVCFYINDFKISGVGPYHEAAILLPITYAGVEGHYVLSMALDNQAATSGGRAVGFPKYIGEVSLTSNGHDWVGTARNQGQVDLQAQYTGECRAEDTFPWPDFINLTPIPAGTPSNEAFLSPRTGSAVMVPAEYLVDPAYHSLRGMIRLEIADDLPWNGLVDESKAFPGHLVSFKGGIDLGNRRLD